MQVCVILNLDLIILQIDVENLVVTFGVAV